MTEKNKEHIPNNVIQHKNKLYLLDQNLKDVAGELDKLSEEEKRIVIERADKKGFMVFRRSL